MYIDFWDSALDPAGEFIVLLQTEMLEYNFHSKRCSEKPF